MSFRFNFFFGYLIDIGWLVFMIFFFKIFYSNISNISGWNFYQIMIILGTYQIYSAIIYDLVIIYNMRRLPRKIWTGELDSFLLRPLNSQFLVSCWEIWPSGFLNLIPSSCLLIYGLKNLRIYPNTTQIISYLIITLLGIVIVYSIWFMVTCLAFFIENVENLPFLPQRTIDYIIEYPVDIFKGKAKFIFTWIIPLAFVCSFPARILMGTLSIVYVFYAFFLAFFFLWLSHKFWHFCLRHYSSASS